MRMDGVGGDETFNILYERVVDQYMQDERTVACAISQQSKGGLNSITKIQSQHVLTPNPKEKDSRKPQKPYLHARLFLILLPFPAMHEQLVDEV